MSVEARATESTKPCEGCDLDEIDALTCKAKEIQKKAEVTTESLQTLDARRADFKAAKDAYTAAWAAAKADVDAATAKLTPLKKELACRLSDQKRQCLGEVWEKVKTEIHECTGEQGCRRFDCDFNESATETDTQATLSGRISELRQKAVELDTYFGDLVNEQTKLPANAAAAKQLVDTLATDAAADTGEKDSVRLYARAVVAEWTIANVWDGFTSIQNYLDCLCQILTCLLKVWKAIVALEGARAERQCGDERKQERCDTLRSDPVDEIVTRYNKECANCDDKSQASPPTAY
jgi:hypothetical protein